MSIEEMKAAFNWAKESIEVFKERGEHIPDFLYDRTLEIASDLIKALEVECGG